MADPNPETAQHHSGEFATTHWSVILLAGGAESADADTALERLCSSYWYPLYAYVRRHGHNSHDAQDLVQEFFARFLERKYLQHADRNRARFRTFLLSSLENFLINEWKKANREKRGGSQRILSLDGVMAEARFAAEPAIEQPPDALYDRAVFRIPAGTHYPHVADGYWLMLAPFSKGKHTIQVHVENSAAGVNQDLIIHLDIH